MSATRTPQGLEDERRELGEALPAYEIGDVLGRGSFAVVYAARHIRLEREVAVKRLSRELLGNGDAGERFAAEARTLALLDHPHVVRVHDYVEQGDVYALVMERLHGGTLAERLRVGSVPRARGCAFTVATLHGLEHAHHTGSCTATSSRPISSSETATWSRSRTSGSRRSSGPTPRG